MKTHIYFILMLILPSFLLAGQPDSISNAERSLPVLNNHYFVPNSVFPSPFMTTFFKTSIGGGSTLNNIPVYADDGEKLLGTIEGENTYVTADIHVQVQAKEWLAAWFRYLANARIGSSAPTILAHGVTAITGFEFGWMLRLWHNNNSLLSGTIAINNSSASAVNLSNYVKDIIANPDSIHSSLSKARNFMDGGAGLRYAYAFNEMIGVQAVINAWYGESILKENRNVWKFDTGILGSLNLVTSHNVPIGFNLGYSIQKYALFSDQKEDNSQSIIFKIAYTGREEYNLGLEFIRVTGPALLVTGENTMKYLETNFVMLYYF